MVQICFRCKDKNVLKECECGLCNNVIFLRDDHYKYRHFVSGHYRKGKGKSYNSEKVFCICGCGGLIRKYDKQAKERRYLKGHHNRKAVPGSCQTRERARRIKEKDICFVNNDLCCARLEIAHIDQNPWNNHEDNLICLCAVHHKLMDKRGLKPEQLKLLKRRIYKTGFIGKVLPLSV